MFFAWIALSYRCEYQQKNIIFNMDPSTVEELIISLATRVAKHFYLLIIIIYYCHIMMKDERSSLMQFHLLMI